MALGVLPAEEEEAVLAKLEATFFACLALAENLDKEKSPKSSESLSLNWPFLGNAEDLGTGLAVADFFGATFLGCA